MSSSKSEHTTHCGAGEIVHRAVDAASALVHRAADAASNALEKHDARLRETVHHHQAHESISAELQHDTEARMGHVAGV